MLVWQLVRPGSRYILWSPDMCLAIPVRVVRVGAGDTALVDLGGVRKEISIALLDNVMVGDFVILHAGYALSKLDQDEAQATLALFAEMGAAPMAEQ